jgi:hypothetical protein
MYSRPLAKVITHQQLQSALSRLSPVSSEGKEINTQPLKGLGCFFFE